MLPSNTLTAVFTLANQLATDQLTVNAKPNTVIAELNRVTNSIVTDSIVTQNADVDQFDLTNFSNVMEQVTKGIEKPSLHDVTIDSFTEDLKKAVTSHIQFARNVVKPIVLDYAAKVKEFVENYKLDTADTRFTVTVNEIPEPLVDSVFIDSLAFYQDKLPLLPGTKAKITPFTTDDFLPYILTGDKNVDEEISKWVTRAGIDKLTATVNDLFNNTASGYDSNNLFKKAEIGLVLYLTGQALYNKADRALNGTSVAAYKNIIAEYRDYGGSLIFKSMAMIDLFRKANMIVLDTNSRLHTIDVFGDIYRTWLNNGGSNDLLYSIVIGNKPYKTVDSIQENIAQLTQLWKSYKVFYDNRQFNQRLEIFKEAIKLKFREIMQELSEEEMAYVNTHAEYHSKVNAFLDNIVNKLKLSHLDNIYDLALHIICQCRFYYTEAEFILSEIEEIGKQNPGIDVREAALIATINYLVDYLCDQITTDTQVTYLKFNK